MYFYIDESGQSGNNLFDKEQPWLYYGLLSSPYDLDDAVKNEILELRKKLSVDELHASELGISKLTTIINELDNIYQKFDINFDFFGINKSDYAIISFFDQVFDQGMNPAVPWTAYWTPLRYFLLVKLSCLFDEELSKKSWAARIEVNNKKAEQLLVEICNELLNRVYLLPDARSIEIITDALKWVIKNPSEIGFNVSSKRNKLEISPNLIGFQYVVLGICNRLKLHNFEATKIVVDKQSEFNNTQKQLIELYQKISVIDEPIPLGDQFMPTMDLKSMPKIPIKIMSSDNSVGLEIVDVHLWIIKRFVDKNLLSNELRDFISSKFSNCYFDCMSLESISERWANWYINLPEPTEDELRKGREFKAKVEAMRKPFIVK